MEMVVANLDMASRRAPRRSIALLGLCALLASAPVLAADTLIRRDGGRASGQLAACVGAICRWNGSSVARAEIAWIGLGETGEPPRPRDASRQEIHLRDGRTVSGEIVGVSLGNVVVGEEDFERSAVSWLYFGAPAAPEARGVPAAPITPALPDAPPAPPTPADRGKAAAGPRNPPPDVETAVAAAAPAPLLLLNEVLFLPGDGEGQFVELWNAGGAPVRLEGVDLRAEGDLAIPLPKDATIAPGGLLVVRLERDLLGRETGALWLRQGGVVRDGVAWGLGRPGAVDLCGGGRCGALRPGSVIARLPGERRRLSGDTWSPLAPDLATPGAPNPRPPVSAFAGVPGMVFRGRPRFSWYSVPGGAGYLVQVAADPAFASVLEEISVTPDAAGGLQQLTAQGAERSPGDYFWRVQVRGPSGEPAAFSPPIAFHVTAPAARSRSGSAAAARLGSPSSRAAGDGESTPAAPPVPERLCDLEGIPEGAVCRELDVPVLDHAKDTHMLVLEAPKEKPLWSWDTPDFAGYPYCARAGVAMVNRYYRGTISQDRLAFEAFEGLRPGPEYDLPVVGIADARTSEYLLPLAIGNSGDFRVNPSPRGDYRPCRERNRQLGCGTTGPCPDCPPELEYAWGYELLSTIKAEIDAGRPLIATSPSHLFLIVGYMEIAEAGELPRGFYYHYQDEGGRHFVGVRGNPAITLQETFESYWSGLVPVRVGRDEPGVSADGDHDGVVDFDETKRFGTDPAKADSDGDGVWDKWEIRYSVWDPESGYHRTVVSLSTTGTDAQIVAAADAANLSGRDPDGDGKAMELDPDSDGGGCKDGKENYDRDGERERWETSNFDPADDGVGEGGTCEGPCPPERPLGGVIELDEIMTTRTSGWRCHARALLRFDLVHDRQVEWPEMLHGNFWASRIAYELSSDGCEDLPNATEYEAEVECTAEGASVSGELRFDGARGYDPSSIDFHALDPRLTFDTLPDGVGLSGASRLRVPLRCVHPMLGVNEGQWSWGPTGAVRPVDGTGEHCDENVVCVSPAPCFDAPGDRATECHLHPDRFAVLPFAGEDSRDLTWADGNSQRRELRWRVCCGCGAEVPPPAGRGSPSSGEAGGEPGGEPPPPPTPPDTDPCGDIARERALVDVLWQQRQLYARELEARWNELSQAHADLLDGVEAYRAAIDFCAIGDIFVEILEGAGGRRTEFVEFVTKLLDGDLSAFVGSDFWGPLAERLWADFPRESDWAGNMRTKLGDCTSLPAGLKEGALGFVDNWERVRQLMPGVQEWINRVGGQDLLYWQRWQTYYPTCLAWARCKGEDPSVCPRPPEEPHGPMPGTPD